MLMLLSCVEEETIGIEQEARDDRADDIAHNSGSHHRFKTSFSQHEPVEQ